MELIKDYDCTIDYHPGKANMVADALSRKSSSFTAYMKVMYLPLLIELRSMGISLAVGENKALLAHFQVRPVLIDQIRDMQNHDTNLVKMKE